MSDDETPITPPETPVTPTAMTDAEFMERLEAAHKQRHEQGRRHGPCYSTPESAPLIWFDQVFDRGIPTQGAHLCATPLRVGATQNALDIVLVASHANSEKVTAASGATVTVTLLQGEKDGEFTEVGPTICVKAPTEGIAADPDHMFARFALGNFSKPWLKVKLEFSGTISGGTVDCALGYVPR